MLLVLSIAAFSGAAVSPSPTIASLFAVAGVVLVYRGTVKWQSRPSKFVGAWAGTAGLVVIVASQYETVGPLHEAVLSIRSAWVALLLLACVSLALARWGTNFRKLSIAAALMAVVVTTLAIAYFDWDAPGGLDVYRNHQSAGDALASGQNPYGDAVEIPNGNPYAPEGSMIVGYSYPPTVLATYGATAMFTDPRIVSTVAWFGIVGWLCFAALRWRDESELSLSALVLVATAPVWPVMWYFGWTEPLSLAMLLLSAVLWRDKPVASAIVLGLALSSKQYFVFLVPLLLLYKGEYRAKRAVIAIGTAGLTLVPALLANAPLYIQANIGNLANIGFRPDTQSVAGLLWEFGFEFSLPVWAWIASSLLFGFLIGPKATNRGDFFLYGSVILSFSFLIGQAFPNYWFLIMGMAAIGTVLKHLESPVSPASELVPVT